VRSTGRVAKRRAENHVTYGMFHLISDKHFSEIKSRECHQATADKPHLVYKKRIKRSNSQNEMSRRQGTYWLGTISCAQEWIPGLPTGIVFLKGQKEEGEEGFKHYQVFFICAQKQSVIGIARTFFPVVGHWELTRSAAAEAYVWKESSRIGEQFCFGQKPIRRNSATDWDGIKSSAVEGKLDEIPADVYIRYYRTLQAISADNCEPVGIERSCILFWGATGSGKSSRAWSEGGSRSYPKDPRSKFWCGYKDQTTVIIDEFRGGIDVSHLLRWLDRYPVNVEIKGSSKPLLANKFFITSNIPLEEWYPGLDLATLSALQRRITCIEMN